ncbi:sulfotransferase domain-containing protein [Thalassovita mediterranea]|nr:sulfotransferase domain-containing protein [Thalassovita mediterranea]
MSELKSGLDPRRRPNLLGIGAAKCGTTWFADVLSRHPDIFLPPQKELGALYYQDLEDRLQEYETHFRGGEEASVRCDFTVRYLHEDRAPGAAALHTPDARILAILRDPVEQVQSHYWHQRRQNFTQPHAVHPAPSLFDAIERFPHLLLEPALYGKHLRRWRERFSDDRILLLDYAEVTKALPATLDRLWTFLGLSPIPIEDQPVQPTRAGRRGVSPREGLFGRIYPPLYSMVTHGPYQAMKRTFGVRRVDLLKRRLKLRQAAEAVFFKTGYPKLGPEERNRLRAMFETDLAVLETDIGFTPAREWRTASDA